MSSFHRAGSRPPVSAVAAASFTTMLVIAAIGFAAVAAIGVDFTSARAATEAPPAPAAAPTLNLDDSPAELALARIISSAPVEWARAGEPLNSVAAPFPYNCPQDRTTPALSVSQSYVTEAGRFQVTIAAYTAGAGAVAMDRLSKGVSACKLDGDRVTSSTGQLGAESRTVTVTRGASVGVTETIRRGDVIGYVTGGSRQLTGQVAATLDTLVDAAISATCLTQTSTVADAERSPWTGSSYVPATAPRTVTVNDAALPRVPADAAYEPVPLTDPLPTVTAVIPHAVPEYPVWPLMPAVVPTPVPLTVPAASAPNSVTVNIPIDDTSGPGCGWAFTGMARPAFDDAAAERSTAQMTATAKTQAKEAVAGWRKSVLSYWAARTPYLTSVDAYTSYAAQVTAVNAAWTVIDKQWATYRANLAVYQKQVSARDAFLAVQRDAQTAYDTAISECEAAGAADGTGSGEVDEPVPSPTPSPTPSASPTSPTAPTVDCSTQVARPAVLDQAAPTVAAAPVQPADPRPAA